MKIIFSLNKNQKDKEYSLISTKTNNSVNRSN